ncbi:substrate-binding domain-containing protein [Dyadobacter luticola]|uniref:Extracellular solute-binding protein n=1 Tax=Dyadobacter luticola TaxID=1979387 RepID=A0A5R9KZ53_9BACT|nr:substrate-binding domain-containing protein [Dyadobacter luticola]TLV01379.1 hypothetical protein FEN17_18280 [Dyadobacter luticola]
MRNLVHIIGFLLLANQAYPQTDTLFVYGPGGPSAAIKECADIFSKETRIPVVVNSGPETKWIEKAKKDADVVFGGSEYMLTQFAADHRGLLDETTRIELYKRSAAILVRPGNPKKIKMFVDLAKPGVRLLDVNGAGQLGMWEDIAGKFDVIAGIQHNIKSSFSNTALGIEAWKSDTTYDAWITYKTWHFPLKEITQLIEIPNQSTVFRGTPIALTLKGKDGPDGKRFLDFLRSSAGHRVFQRWGWE